MTELAAISMAFIHTILSERIQFQSVESTRSAEPEEYQLGPRFSRINNIPEVPPRNFHSQQQKKKLLTKAEKAWACKSFAGVNIALMILLRKIIEAWLRSTRSAQRQTKAFAIISMLAGIMESK